MEKKKKGDNVTFVQAMTTLSDMGEGDLFRGGVPIGGIGTGKIEICADGSVTNITTNCNIEAPICDGYASAPAKIVPGGVPGIFWALWDESGAKVLKVQPPKGLPGVSIKNMHYDARLPVCKIDYTGIGPIEVKLCAYSPLILGDTSEKYKDSSIPGAIFEFTLINTTDKAQSYRFMYSWQNMVGITGYYNERNWGICDNRGNSAEFRDDEKYPGAWFFTADEEKKDPRARGNYSLRVQKVEGTKIEFRTWKDATELWGQFASNQEFKIDAPWLHGSDAVVSVAGKIEARSSVVLRYAVGWYFKNLVEERHPEINYGRNYEHFFKDSWDAAGYLLENHERLYKATTDWQAQIFKSNLPEWFKYKMCDDLFPILTNSWYTKDGSFTISEAVTNMGAMMGTIDQRNASQAPYLISFPKLCRSELDLFREKQARPGSDDEYGVHWNFETGTPDIKINHVGAVPHDIGHEDLRSYAICPAVEWNAGHWPDLQSGYILQWYAYYCWTNDPVIKSEVYESCKLTEGFLRRLDFNGDCVPDLWGWGSSSYDNWSFPYYGVMPYVATMYMAALAAMEKMARQMGELDYAKELAARRKKAAETLVSDNWNGSYFKCWTHKEHEKWSSGVRAHGPESDSIHVSQLAGQWYASMMGLGYLLDQDLIDTALQTIADKNHSIVSGCAPIEVWPAKNPGEKDKYGESWPHYTEAYFASLAIYESQKDIGMEQLYKLWKVLVKNNARWDCGLGIAGEQNDQLSGRWYMTNTAGWFCMLALAGFWIDLPGKELLLSPNVPPSMGNELLNVPILAQNFWASVSRTNFDGGFTAEMKLTRLAGAPMSFDKIKTRVAKNETPVSVEVEINGKKVDAKFDFDEYNRYVVINLPFELKNAGDEIKLTVKTASV